MKKVFLAICIAVISSTSYGQKGTNAIGIGAESSFPIGDFVDAANIGFGGYVKFLYGIGEAGAITFTSGYTTYNGKLRSGDFKYSFNIIPVLVGYRHNFSGFYVEPQVGYMSLGFKNKSDLGSSISSKGGFAYAAGVGYTINGFDIGFRYQGSSIKFTNTSVFNTKNTSVIGIRIGYNISLR